MIPLTLEVSQIFDSGGLHVYNNVAVVPPTRRGSGG